MDFEDFDDFENDASHVKVWAKKQIDNSNIHASAAHKRDGPFYCPDTYEELIVRKCVDKIDHFAYKVRYSPIVTKPETELHKACKHEILKSLTEMFPEGKWEVERQTFKENKEKGLKRVIPDISGRNTASNCPIIIEIQASFLSISQIIQRTLEYSKRGAFILWVIPLKQPLGTDNFRPRLFERFLHQMYYGRIYYWRPGLGRNVMPVHYDTAERYIEENTWYEEGGFERTEGGYFKSYRRIKSPNFGKVLDIGNDFVAHEREKFTPTNEKMEVPACRVFKDNLINWWHKPE